jgi:hypothetical protein
MSPQNSNPTDETQKDKNTNENMKTSTIGKKCTFPDFSSFPIHSIFDVTEDYSMICYFNEGMAQVIWVPNSFISND